MRYIAEDATLRFKFTTRQFSTGAPFTLAGTPSLSVYPEDSATQITAGITLTADYDSKTGLNDVVIDLSASASYAAGKKYEVVIEAGTVDSVSVVGEVVYEFYIHASGGLEALITRGILALPAAAADAPGGVPISDAGGLDLDNRTLSATAVDRMNASAGTIVKGTVDNSAHTPTTTEFEADDITEATADHYNGRIIIFTSGALTGQATDITDYALSGSNGHFTVTALTEAPGNNDTFIIV